MRRSPTSPLQRSPPTPSSASASATVFPCTLAYPEAEASSARSRPRAASAGRACLRGHAARRGVVTGSPLLRSLLVDRRGPPRCLGRPLHECRGRTPRPARRPSPTRCDSAAPGNLEARGARNQSIFEAASPRPSCSRTYASPPPSRDAAQGSLPACWLGFGRAGFAPAGRRTGFRKATACLLLPDQPCLVAPRIALGHLGSRGESCRAVGMRSRIASGCTSPASTQDWTRQPGFAG
jgi:hypothetical protein